MTSYKERVLLDRYAVKDSTRELQVGDMVVASVQRMFDREARVVESREIGHVCSCHDDQHYDVRIANEQKEVVERIPRNRLEYCVEQSYQDICDRVAVAVAEEDDDEDSGFYEAVYNLMLDEKFIPAGRPLAGLGRDDFDLTLFNCYVYGIESDSRAGISNHWARLFETYSRGGGIGWNLSILRPKGAVVRKVNGRSSGSVSWAEQFSQITGAVEQGGSRRGAGLQGLEVWHPDILEFIDCKAQREEFRAPDGQVVSRNLNQLKNSNVSVLITKGFMKAVEQDTNWELVFPDLDDPDYDKEWDGDLERWHGELGKKIVTYRTIRAKKLWDTITQRAWESGEPGIIFLDRANELSNSYYYNRLTSTNPCGEVFLPPNGVCNLSHLNVSRFAKPEEQFPEQERAAADAAKHFDWDAFTSAIHTGIQFLNIVIDLNRYHEEAIKEQQLTERRVGLGILGYGELLIRLGLRYGSEEAITFTARLMKHLSTQSYLASAELAKALGPFPGYDAEQFLKGGFMKKHVKAVKDAVAEHGIRNVTVNTVAPTGSVGALLQTSGGCEPFFELEYTSTTRIGVVRERMPIVEDLAQRFGPDRTKWPSYVVTAQQGIAPLEHVRTQGCMQRWVDASISKTINLPNQATVEDVADAYMEMWRVGCKGGTVYRNNSRDEQVLYVDPTATEEVQVEVVTESAETSAMRRRPDVGHSITFSEKSPVGTVHATIRHDPISSEPVDIFVAVGKGDLAADAEALGRLMSMILQFPNNTYVSQQARLQLICNQLINILGRGQEGYGPSAKRSLPDTIAKILNMYLAADFPMAHLPVGKIQMAALLDELQKLDKNSEAFDKLRSFILDEEVNGTEEAEAHRETMEAQIEMAEAKGVKVPYDVCPYCGNVTMVSIPGKCNFCRACGESMC